MKTLIDYLGERLNIVRGTCYGILAATLAYSLYVDTSHAHTWVEKNVPFFWSIFAFAGAAAIIGIAYWFGHSGIMVREDYYEKDSAHCCGGSGPEGLPGQTEAEEDK
jgi:hypothetical protein